MSERLITAEFFFYLLHKRSGILISYPVVLNNAYFTVAKIWQKPCYNALIFDMSDPVESVFYTKRRRLKGRFAEFAFCI